MSMTEPLWHLLQVSDVLDLEFASALAESVPVLAWKPQRTLLPERVAAGMEEELASDSQARLRSLPLRPGFARFPLSVVMPVGKAVVERLLRQTADPLRSPLVCTTPFFAPVAELWPGPVVYWLTDLIAEYPSADRATVRKLDRRMCRTATVVAPNSQRLADYLIGDAGCDPAKIQILPNATRAVNLTPVCPTGPMEKPTALREVKRPIAGVIGNLAGNMDWLLLRNAVQESPWLEWVFVGPVSMAIADGVQRQARTDVMNASNASFVGKQPYGELAAYARAFDVAVLPYLRCEPTYSGSSTRFYEHLAACRPMIATRGLEELTRKTPLLTLVDTPGEMIAELRRLAMCHFDDGLLDLRWRASQTATWQSRAATLREALGLRSPVLMPECLQNTAA